MKSGGDTDCKGMTTCGGTTKCLAYLRTRVESKGGSEGRHPRTTQTQLPCKKQSVPCRLLR